MAFSAFILASRSPRRSELLQRFGFDFDIRGSDAETEATQKSDSRHHVLNNALAKGLDVRQSLPKDESSIILAADTIVVVDGLVLEKPKSNEAAKEMLKMLSGRVHQVLTAFALLPHGATGFSDYTEVVETKVGMINLTDEMIEKYVSTGDPLDKAGSYGIQGMAAAYISHIEGCFYNVMGLPLSRLEQALKAYFNLSLFD